MSKTFISPATFKICKNVSYQDFIEGKIVQAPKKGFEFDLDLIPSVLKPHQKDMVKFAVNGGNRAIFASFGLGKTVIQLSILKVIQAVKGGKHLIVCPLGVRGEFQRNAENLLEMAHIPYVRNNEEIQAAGDCIMLTNYERVRNGQIDVSQFTAVTLDEASILRGYGTKTYQTFLPLFANVQYKFVCTATPSPNRYKEIIHYAGFLGVMDTGQALTRFFKRDSTKANKLTLMPSMEKEFWLWISTWAAFVYKPSDLGYSDVGYDLPAVEVRTHIIPYEMSQKADSYGQIQMLEKNATSLSEISKVKRDSLPSRLEKAKEIIMSSDDNFILWYHLEKEREMIGKAIPECKHAYGNQDLEERENLIADFSEGKFRVLGTKPEIAGSGCNFQKHCHRAVFLGINYSFNDFIQAIHRIQRFLQKETVIIDIIYDEREEQVYKVFLEKWANHKKMVEKMQSIVKKYGLAGGQISELKRALYFDTFEFEKENVKFYRNDCIQGIKDKVADNSVGHIVTSIPFANHYEYSANYSDFGHTKNNTHFWQQMGYLIPQLYRVLMPGRIAAIHVKDRIVFGNATGLGFPTVSPFHSETITAFQVFGFEFIGMITITTDVVRENNQTYRLGYTEMCKDGSKMGVGSPEYLCLFRKKPTDTSRAYADLPVKKEKHGGDYSLAKWQIDAAADWRSSGNTLLCPSDFRGMELSAIQALFKFANENSVYDYQEHVKMGEKLGEQAKLPTKYATFPSARNTDWLWNDILRMNTLNSEQAKKKQENHICPLQIDIVERCIERYSNKGDVVLDPFGGIGTVPKLALDMGRKGVGFELNKDYYDSAVLNIRASLEKINTPTLFDIL